MPRLLLFAPCEKVLINQQDNTTSLITLLEQVSISVPESEESKLPDDTVIPLSWHIIALWQSEPKDEGKKFEMLFSALMPGGKESKFTGEMPIAFEPGKPNFRNVINIMGFPIVPAGTCQLRLSVREEGREWQLASEFYMEIVRPTRA